MYTWSLHHTPPLPSSTATHPQQEITNNNRREGRKRKQQERRRKQKKKKIEPTATNRIVEVPHSSHKHRRQSKPETDRPTNAFPYPNQDPRCCFWKLLLPTSSPAKPEYQPLSGEAKPSPQWAPLPKSQTAISHCRRTLSLQGRDHYNHSSSLLKPPRVFQPGDPHYIARCQP